MEPTQLLDNDGWQVTLNTGDQIEAFINEGTEANGQIFSKDPATWSAFVDEHWPHPAEYVYLLCQLAQPL